MTVRIKYPLGIQTFSEIREENYIYIDKTPLIYDLVTTGKVYFLSRPRRFGKSLLVSTLHSLFNGDSKLFDDLAISKTDYDFITYPVLKFEFSSVDVYQADDLKQYIINTLDDLADSYGIELIRPSYDQRFAELVRKLHRNTKHKVVILIDEYDKPILSNLDNLALTDIKEGMNAFYSVAKSLDPHLKFVLITGVSKFAKVSVFSGMNNLTDISMNKHYACLCGVTEQELTNTFYHGLTELAKIESKNGQTTLDKIKHWYNGYHFHQNAEGVYNPYSILCLLNNQEFKNYWYATATPTFLLDLLQKKQYDLSDVNQFNVVESTFAASEPEDMEVVSLLLQTGYLSIKSYQDPYYQVDFPNHEVRKSFYDSVITRYSYIEKGLGEGFVFELIQQINKGDIDGFITILKRFFANIPYDITLKKEKYYQSLFYAIFKLLGLSIEAEVRTNDGRIDCVIITDNKIYIIEFKLGNSKEAALRQIIDKQYAQKYQSVGKKIILLGVEFSHALRNISDYKYIDADYAEQFNTSNENGFTLREQNKTDNSQTLTAVKKLSVDEQQRHPNLDEHHRDVIEQLESVVGESFEEDKTFFKNACYEQKQQQITALSIENTELNQQQFSKVIKLLSTCQQLTQLSFYDCQLNDLAAIKNLSKLKYLRQLYLHKNQIKDLTLISYLSNLTTLAINSNPIEPHSLSTLVKTLKLNRLLAANCHLNKLDFLTQSEYLTQVYLSGNRITTIPQWLVEPTASSSSNSTPFTITFDYDEFDKYPETQKVILLADNPITTPPIEIAKRGNEAILNYYQQLASQTKNDHLFEAKMLIVGEPGAGKTSLARKINNPQAALPKEADTTHGIDVLDYQFKIHQQDFPNYQGEQSIEGKTFTTNLWDFGGQKIYLATHRFFLSNRALYVLISDSRTENTDFNYWLHVVEMFSPHSPILIILNEKDQRQHQFDPSLLKSRFNNIVDVQAVDLKSNDHKRLNEVRHVIRHHISKLPHVGSPLPGSWLEVRDKLNSITTPTIRPDQYLDICNQGGIDNKTDAMQLSQYFHDIGVFLHFQNDEVLKHTIFLDSNWTTNTIYALLDDKSVFNNRGIIGKKQAMDIWRQDAVNDKCDEFFRLMKVFHLAFEFKNSGQYIVPAKLPFASEEQLQLKPTGTNIQLGYKYNEFMPRGLLFNLMVELQHLINDKSKIWQQAAIFFKGRTQALVIEDYYTRTISINIGGDNPRDLLVIIMDKLDEINRQYQKLKVTKQIPCICAQCKVDEQPHFYGYDILQRRQQNNRTAIECEKSYDDVNVSELLAQVASSASVDAATGIIASADSRASTNRNQIFISYSHNDAAIFERVTVHFKGVKNAKNSFIYWEDTQIKTGSGWFEDIKQNLAKTKVAVLLISADFLASEFIQQQELPKIFTAMEQQGATIIPVLVSDCSLKNHPSLSGIQCVNKLDKPLDSLSNAQKETYLKTLTETVDKALNG